MNRRDLLLWRTTSTGRVVELPCERLYMQFLDACRPAGAAGPSTSAGADRRGTIEPAPADDYQLGEPEARYQTSSTSDLFDGIAGDLEGARVLRIVDERWLADPELRRRVDALVARFRAAGGRVEFVPGQPA